MVDFNLFFFFDFGFVAYIYFHRFFQIRSFKLHDPHRIATACLYLACKYEDHPNYKDHLVRITHLLLFRKDLNKNDKVGKQISLAMMQ